MLIAVTYFISDPRSDRHGDKRVEAREAGRRDIERKTPAHSLANIDRFIKNGASKSLLPLQVGIKLNIKQRDPTKYAFECLDDDFTSNN